MLIKINDVITECLDEPKLGLKLNENKAVLFWNEVVGDDVAKNTRPTAVRNNILFVSTNNPVWAHQLTIMKTKIIETVNKKLKTTIKDIRFQPRGIN
ncbi:MAG TPA: DUF721 domain-containing protein [Actinobacteria bacterium]|nr:DUF721 domain-containing protein [Actinomycetes bacterium]HEX21314.1 DUF721 domain-containing protein [Actinomycetota bacterium]